MMKKYFYPFFAVLSMLWMATSCSQEEMIENGASGNEVEVSFNVEMEGQTASRAIADGLTVDQLIFAVFDENNQEIEALRQEDVVVSNKGAVVKTRLVKGQSYQFVFWAQKKDAGHYNTTSMKNIKLNTTVLNNDETRDAFYAHEPLYKVTGSFIKPITLKRPFAQLNLATTKEDLEWAEKAGVVIDKSSVKVTGAVYSTLNTLSGYCADKVEGEFELSLNAIPDAATEKLTITDSEDQFENDDYYYLSTSYLLVSPKEALTEEIVFTLTAGDTDEVINTLTVTNAPLQRNWRTNIIGEILTGEGTFNIVIDPIFDADRNYPMDGSNLDIWDGKSTEPQKNEAGEYVIDQASDLAYIWQQEATKWNNATFRLTKDLSFKNVEWDSRAEGGDTTPATIEPLFGEGNGASSVTFYGDDHVIRDFIIDGQNKLNSLFGGMVGGSIHNLTIINATVKGMNDENARAAIAVAQTFGTVTFENITIKDSYLEGTQKVGGLIGFVHENQVEVTNCTVDGLELIGLDNAEAGSNGGLIGCINQGENKITNSYVKNSTFNLIQKSDKENEIAKRANGEFIGLIRGASTIVNITNCGVENNEYNNSIPWEPFHPQFVGGNFNEAATLIVNGKSWPELLPDYVDKDTYLEVYTAKGLLKWAYRVNAGEKSLGLELMNDITMPAFEIAEDAANETYVVTTTPIEVTDGVPSGYNWISLTPNSVGDGNYFRGEIEGNNKSIKGLRIIGSETTCGFIGYMQGGGYVKNLTFDNAVIYSTYGYVGTAVGVSHDGTLVENVHVNNSTIQGTSTVAGIVGRNYRRIKEGIDEKIAIIRNCTTDENTLVKGTGSYVGGICGENNGALVINCGNDADVVGVNHVAGVCGMSREYNTNVNSYLIACRSSEYATVTATNGSAGGIVGYTIIDQNHNKTGFAEAVVIGCYSLSTISASKGGGVILGAKNNSIIRSCWGAQKGVTTVGPGTNYAAYAFADENAITQEAVDNMNKIIDEYNAKVGTDYEYACPQWSWTAGSWPVLVQE